MDHCRWTSLITVDPVLVCSAFCAAIVLGSLLLGAELVLAHTPHHAIDALAVSPDYTNDQEVFVIVQNRLLQSADGGNSWKQRVNGIDTPWLISDIALSPQYGEDDILYVASDGGGVYVSMDRGRSFAKRSNGLSDGRIGMLHIMASEGTYRVLAAGSRGGMYLWSDDSEIWERVVSDDVQIMTVLRDGAVDAQHVFAADSNGGVWMGDTQLRNWHRAFRLADVGPIQHMTLSQNHLLLGTRERGLVRTDLDGKGLTFLSLTWPLQEARCRDHRLTAIAPDNSVRQIGVAEDADSLLVLSGHHGLFSSSDGGVSWTGSNAGLSCDPQAETNAFRVPQFREIATQGSDWFLAGFNGLFRSADEGRTWSMLDTLPVDLIRGFDVAAGEGSSHSIAVGTYGGGAYVSRDSGATWSIANKGLLTTRIAEVQFAPDGELFALAKEHLLKLETDDVTWMPQSLVYRGWRRRLGAGLERRLGVSPRFGTEFFLESVERGSPWPMQMAFAPDFAVNGVMFVGLRNHGIWRSENAGAEWGREWPAPSDYVTALEVSPNFAVDRTVFAAIRGVGVVVSKDAGGHWASVDGKIPSVSVPDTTSTLNYVNDPPLQRAISDVRLAISPGFAEDSVLFAGSATGLFSSTDRGVSWSRLLNNSDVGDAPVRALALSPRFTMDGTMVISVSGHGLYVSTDSGENFAPLAERLSASGFDANFLRFSPSFSQDGMIFAASDEEIVTFRMADQRWTTLARPARYEDWRGAGSGPIQFTGDWSREANTHSSANSQTVSQQAGATASLVFSGSRVSWLGERCPSCGLAAVSIDGEPDAAIDLYATQTEYTTVFAADDLQPGVHRLDIEVLGESAPQSSGQRVVIDAVDAVRAQR